MQKTWKIKSNNASLNDSLSKELNISPILAQILINRNITDAEEARHFLYGDISSSYDPFLLKDMDKSVARIKKAVEKKEKILIYGDYDVDGITSSALLKIILRELGNEPEVYIPNRLEEGYGLNPKAVKWAKEKHINLIITVDCGIGAIEEVKQARHFGIDVIVTDHHEVKKESLPPAFSIINPHQAGCSYPFKYLAGCGIAYKLCQGLLKKKYYHLEEHLDLVALGTIADIAPQKSENRIFTKYGTAKLNETKKIGLKSLIAASGLEKKDISSSHIGYILGPRINAMGRIGSANIALKLLLTDNRLEGDRLANIMSQENKNRQRIEADILEEALIKTEREINFKEHKIIVLAKENWHPGVIGIVASRIQDRFYRPAIMIALDKDKGRGSGRSIGNFNLFNAVSDSKDLLLDFGGHEAACGLSIQKQNIEKFIKRINDYTKKNITEKDLSPKLNIEAEIPFSALTMDLMNELDILQPHGPENPRPIFSSSGVVMRDEPRFMKRNGLKMFFTSGGITREAVTFKRESINIPGPGEKIDIAYSPGINSWQGIDSIQLDLRDLKIKSRL